MNDLSGIVFGAVKHARRQEDRQRRTHGGLSRHDRPVLNELPPNLECHRSPSPDNDEQELQQYRRFILESHMREFTPDDRWIDLLRRRLMNDESIREIADDLALNYSSARRKVCEARRYLGLD
ncbi:MAG: hypothetical protein R3C19_27090 [Planctomycetaceae bacterium]